jgi:hypothetical protein
VEDFRVDLIVTPDETIWWATAKVERTQQRGNGDRSSGRERAAERGGDFDEAPPF